MAIARKQKEIDVVRAALEEGCSFFDKAGAALLTVESILDCCEREGGFQMEEPKPRCKECGQTIDRRLPGDGHRGTHPICGQYTFHVNPKFQEFARDYAKKNPGDGGKTLLRAWMKYEFGEDWP